MDNSNTGCSKFTRPSVRDVLPRQRLFNTLASGKNYSAIWLAGPPGSGKTTLVADYLKTLDQPCIWYRVDQGDADIATFFHYFTQAANQWIQTGDSALPRFTPEYLNDTEAFTRNYFRALFLQLKGPFAIVIDNYQEVPMRSRLHELTRAAMEQLPEHGSAFLISRRDPPPAMARFRANSEILVVDWEQLRLTESECGDVAELKGHHLSPETLGQLYARTQGWAAGVILLLEHLKGDGSVTEMPQQFTPKVIFDYLAGEIIRNYDERLQTFLMQTAMPHQISAEMAQSISGQDDASEILERFAQRDYLISARPGSHGMVYEYHPLLRDYLINKLNKEWSREALKNLKMTTASELECHGFVDQAIELRLSSEDWSEASRLINKHAAQWLRQGRGETLERWLESFPDELIETDPWMLYWKGASQFRNTLRESRRLFIKAYRLFQEQAEPDRNGLFAACIEIMNTIGYELDDLSLFDEWISEVELLTQKYPDFTDHPQNAPLSAGMYLALYTRQPFHPDFALWAERTLQLIKTHPDTSVRIHAVSILISGIVWTGRFTLSLELIESIRRSIDLHDVPPVAEVTLRNAEASYYMLHGDFDAGMQAVRAGLKSADESGIHYWRNSTLLHGIIGALCTQDLETADELFAQLDQREIGARRYDAWQYLFYCAWRCVLADDVLGAYEYLRKAIRLANELSMPFFELMSHLWMAQVLFASDDVEKGTYHLKMVRKMSKSLQNYLFEFISFHVYAWIALNHGRRSSALRALRYALKLGREHGFNNMVWWEPKMMSELFVVALEEGIEVDYVTHLVRTRKVQPSAPPIHLQNWPWVMRVHTFGAFELSHCPNASCEKKLLDGRPAELLKVLISLGGKDVSVSRISDAMWPRIDADYAQRSFNTTLHRLRKALGDDQLLALQSGRLSLNGDLCWLDSWAFEKYASELIALLRETHAWIDLPRASWLANQVLALYRGAFFDQDDSPWVVVPRDQWKQKFVRAIGDMAIRLKEAKAYEQAIDVLERGIETDSLIERFYQQLMTCYVQTGRKVQAAEVYHRAVAMFQSQFQMAPSEELQRSYQLLVAD